MNRRTTLVIAATLAAALFSCGRNEQPAPQAPQTQTATAATAATPAEAPAGAFPEVGSSMPSIEITDLSGASVDLAKADGKVRLVNLWATWCGPCRAEIPDLKLLHQNYAPKGFEVVGVSVDSSDAKDQVASFMKEQGIGYPILLDPDNQTTTAFNTSVIPTTVLLDRSGKVIWFHAGMLTADDGDLKSAIEQALARG